MNNKLVTLETYAQEPYPNGINIGNDDISDEWLDNHLTQFKVKIDDLKNILKNEFNDTINNFNKTWTWDYAEQIFDLLDDNQKYDIKFIEG